MQRRISGVSIDCLLPDMQLWKVLLPQLVSFIGRRAHGHATRVLSDSLAVIPASTRVRSSRRGMCRALRSMAAVALTYGTLACHAVGPFRDQSRRSTSTAFPDTRFAHDTPARRASHSWHQVVSSPSCGHRRSGGQRRGVKKALARARTTTSAGGEKEQTSSPTATSLCAQCSGKDGPRADVRRPKDAERQRAVAAPTRVLDAGDLRLVTPNSANIDLGVRQPNNPRLGERTRSS